MPDLSILARKALVSALKADVPLTTLVPTARIYGPEPPATPTWPWAYVASPLMAPARATCLNGARLSVTIHGFAKGPGDDAASAIGWAIGDALDGKTIPLPGANIDCTLEQIQVIRDSAEASSYHTICRFAVEIGA